MDQTNLVGFHQLRSLSLFLFGLTVNQSLLMTSPYEGTVYKTPVKKVQIKPFNWVLIVTFPFSGVLIFF